jgi:hypothetical protein
VRNKKSRPTKGAAILLCEEITVQITEQRQDGEDGGNDAEVSKRYHFATPLRHRLAAD